MIYPFSLFQVGLALGLLLIASHACALVAADTMRPRLLAFPRSRIAGTILIFLAGLWAFALMWTMDLGEFARLRSVLLWAIAIGTILSWRFVTEFLAVRALGILLLLGASILLNAAFLQPQTSRLLLVVLAYTWIFLGLFWVGMPYLFRDQVQWFSSTRGRWKTAAYSGLIYGVAILLCSLFFYR